MSRHRGRRRSVRRHLFGNETRKTRKASFLNSLLEVPPPPAQRGLIQVPSVEIMKIPDHERHGPLLPGMSRSCGIEKPDHYFAARSQAPAGYHDERMIAIEEGATRWKMSVFWKAEGPGAAPDGVRMLTQFGSLFNNLFNMLVDQEDLAQEVHSSSRKTADIGKLFQGLLGF